MKLEDKMIYLWYFFMAWMTTIYGAHFNGGTIRWYPNNPSENSSSVTITIVQTYFWEYPLVVCANNVPISTPSRSGSAGKIHCVVDCSTDGGYSANPITTLTDCVSTSTAAGMMVSERAVNTTLTADAHFYASYAGNAWTALNSPRRTGLEWSILFSVDLRKRPDGLINTPPVVQVVSPQYAIVNRTLQIPLHVSDANPGDDIRCRWSIQTPGQRRRRNSNEQEQEQQNPIQLIRKKRLTFSSFFCAFSCVQGCSCNGSQCLGTNCTGATCTSAKCTSLSATTKTTKTTTTTDIMSVTNSTAETSATLRSTSSFPVRQAIDECGDICFPTNIPNDTTITNCTINFRGLVADTWYAVAIQVEDFISSTSNTPLSSVPVQLLIYVKTEPTCLTAPTIIPLEDCHEVAVGTTKTFELVVFNPCDADGISIREVLVSKGITGLNISNLTSVANDSSMISVTVSWTPQSNQIGTQKFCTIAFTDEQVPSAEYCITFLVKSTLPLCVNTTTSITVTRSNTPAGPITIYKIPDWDLAMRILSLVLPLTICTACCLYQFCLNLYNRRRQKDDKEKENDEQKESRKGGITTTSSIETSIEITPAEEESSQIEVPERSYQVYFIQSNEYRALSAFSLASIRTSSSASTTRTSTTNVTEKETKKSEESKDVKKSTGNTNLLQIESQVTAANRLSFNKGIDFTVDSGESSDDDDGGTSPVTPPPNLLISFGQSDWSDVQQKNSAKPNHNQEYAEKNKDVAHWARRYIYGLRASKTDH